jgi:hypothetical protein
MTTPVAGVSGERTFGGYPIDALRKGWFQLEGEQCIAIVTDLLDALDKAEYFAGAMAWMLPPDKKIGEVHEAAARYEAALRSISETAPKWRRPDVDPPADEQRVLGYWAPNSVHPDPIFESLTYTAADAPDGPEVWRGWADRKEDAPDLWAPLEALGVPK